MNMGTLLAYNSLLSQTSLNVRMLKFIHPSNKGYFLVCCFDMVTLKTMTSIADKDNFITKHIADLNTNMSNLFL